MPQWVWALAPTPQAFAQLPGGSLLPSRNLVGTSRGARLGSPLSEASHRPESLTLGFLSGALKMLWNVCLSSSTWGVA